MLEIILEGLIVLIILGLSVEPIIKSKRNEEILPGFSFGIDRYGEDEIHIPTAAAGSALQEYINEETIPPNSILKVMSYDFPEREWGEDTPWVNWIKRLHREKNIQVIAVGGPEVKASDSIRLLIKDKALKEIRTIKKEQTFHLFLTPPHQLWVEQFHKNGNAINCTFTNKPDDWGKANRHFDYFFNKGTLWT